MRKAIIRSMFLVAFLLLVPFPLTSPAQAVTGGSSTVYSVGQTATGSIDENDSIAVILFDIDQTGFYEVNITGTNTHETSTADIDISLRSRTSTYDPINDLTLEDHIEILESFPDGSRHIESIGSVYPNTSDWSIWNIPVVNPRIITITLELTTGITVDYEVTVARLYDLDLIENRLIAGDNIIDWNDTEFGRLLYLDIMMPTVYNLTFEQNVTDYNSTYASTGLRMRVSGFNASEDQLEVVFNNHNLGYIIGDITWFSFPSDYIVHDVTDGNNVTLVYTNKTAAASLSIIDAQVYRIREDGGDEIQDFSGFTSPMDYSNDISTQLRTLDSYTVPVDDSQEVVYSLTYSTYGYHLISPLQLSDNDTTSASLITPYLQVGRYYLNLTREYLAPVKLNISLSALSTLNLTAGNSLQFTYSISNQTDLAALNLSSASYVIVHLPEGRYDRLSLHITSGINWTIYGLPIIQGGLFLPTLTHTKYNDSVTPISYQEWSSVDIISKEFVPSFGQWATGENFNTHEILPVSLLDTNGSLSIATGLFGLFSDMHDDVLAFAVGGQDAAGYAATATVTFNLSLTDLNMTSLQSPTTAVPSFNAALGNIMDILTLEVAVGNEYTVIAEPLSWTSHGYVSVQVAAHTGEDWLHWYLPTYVAPCTLQAAAINESVVIEYVPVRNGKVYIIVMGYDTVSTLGDTTSIRVNITNDAVRFTVAGTPSNTVAFSQIDNVTLLTFTASQGYTYTIEFFSEEGMVDPFCDISFFDARGINQFSSVLSGYLIYDGSSAHSVTYIARSTGAVHIAVYGRVTFGTVTVTVTLSSAPPPNLFLGLAIGIPAGVAVGVTVFWALVKKGIPMKKET